MEQLLNPLQNEEEEAPAQPPKTVSRKRKLLVPDSEIEISKKEYSRNLKDTSAIVKKVLTRLSRVKSSNDFCHAMRLY